jgi:hypothetical protein
MKKAMWLMMYYLMTVWSGRDVVVSIFNVTFITLITVVAVVMESRTNKIPLCCLVHTCVQVLLYRRRVACLYDICHEYKSIQIFVAVVADVAFVVIVALVSVL